MWWLLKKHWIEKGNGISYFSLTDEQNGTGKSRSVNFSKRKKFFYHEFSIQWIWFSNIRRVKKSNNNKKWKCDEDDKECGTMVTLECEQLELINMIKWIGDFDQTDINFHSLSLLIFPFYFPDFLHMYMKNGVEINFRFLYRLKIYIFNYCFICEIRINWIKTFKQNCNMILELNSQIQSAHVYIFTQIYMENDEKRMWFVL